MDAQVPAGTPATPPPSRGFPVWAIVAIVAGVVAVAAVVTVLLVNQDSDPVETAPPVVGPTDTPQGSTAVDQLTAYLPPEVSNCTDVNAGDAPEEGLAEVACGATSGENGVLGFTLYESPEAALAAYEADVAAEGVTFDSGDCSVDTLAEHGWSGDGGQGRIACYQDDFDQGRLAWTSDGYPIVGTVYVTTASQITVQEAYTLWQGISDYTPQA